MSEYRGLLTAITFMGIFAFLILAIPAQFISDADMREVNYPDTWDSSQLLYIAESYNYTTLGASTDVDFEIGGRTCNLLGSAYPSVLLRYVWYDLWIFRNTEPCFWLEDTGGYVNASHPNSMFIEELTANYNETDRFIAEFRYQSQFKMYVVFSYDDGTYGNFTHAFDNDALYFWCGIQFDQINTSYNAWDIISMLLFFQLPDVHWAINALVAIPIWIVIVYVSFIVILRVIGAVFGGGGA